MDTIQQMFFHCLIFLIITLNKSIFAITPYSGDRPGSFTFDLLNFSTDIKNHRLYVCASTKPSFEYAKQFSISVLEKNGKQFYPLLNEQSIIDGKIKQNPLYGNNFSFLETTTINTQKKSLSVALVVPSDENTIYAVITPYIFNKNSTIIISTNAITDFIGISGKIKKILPYDDGFALISTASNFIFPDPSSNTALSHFIFDQTYATKPGGYEKHITLLEKSKKEISPSHPAFSVNGGTVSLQKPLISTVNKHIKKIYSGSGGTGENGIRAVIVDDTYIIPESACKEDSIIATTNSTTPVIINNLCSTTLSSGLDYLIINGGITGSDYVYGLPLVNDQSSAFFGELAAISQSPSYIFRNGYPYDYQATVLSKGAQIPDDIYSSSDSRAQVGKGALKIDDTRTFSIQSLEAYQDTVFAQAHYTGTGPGLDGIFYSQGLLNEQGIINAWTPWQRKSIIGQYNNISYCPFTGAFNGFLPFTQKIAITNQWTTNTPTTAILDINLNDLPCKYSGIQTIIDIPYMHKGIGLDINSLKPSYALYLGHQTVILQQTARENGLLPETIKHTYVSHGSLETFNSTDSYTSLIFEGSTFDSTNTLITGGLAYTDYDSWLVVGGTDGIYILCDEEGKGCGTEFLQPFFQGITSSMKWKKIGSIKGVKKVITQKNNIYVLTHNACYRIELNNTLESQQNFSYYTIIDKTSITTVKEFFFTDFLISNNACLIGTTHGLYINKNSIASSITPTNATFQALSLPENNNYGCISMSAIAASGSNDEWGIASNEYTSGNIYVVMGNIAHHQAVIYRLTTYDNSNTPDISTTIKIIPNYFIQNIPSYYYNLKDSKLSAHSDGASWYSHYQYPVPYGFKGILEVLNPIGAEISSIYEEANIILQSKTPLSPLGCATYISGFGLWACPSKEGIYQLW